DSFTVLELQLVPGNDPPPWMLHSYLVALESDWQKPQALRDDLERHLSLSRHYDASKKTQADPFLNELNRNEALQQLLNQTRQQELQQAPFNLPTGPNAPVAGNSSLDALRNFDGNPPGQQTQMPGGVQRGGFDPDTKARASRGSVPQAYNTANRYEAVRSNE